MKALGHLLRDPPVLQENLRSACFRLMRPLARILLRNGVTAHEFGNIANAAFVRAAEEVLTEQGQDPSFSRISTITGIHRHAVSTLAAIAGTDTVGEFEHKDYQRNRIARVLTGWYESPDFTDNEGKPLLLSFEEGEGPSFSSLVRQFSGDIYPRIILDELLRVRAVRMTRDGRIRVVSKRYTVGGADPESIEALGDSTRHLLTTVEHNLATDGVERLVNDSAVSFALPRRAIPVVRQQLTRRIQAFLEDAESTLRQHEFAGQSKPPEDCITAGLTVHMWLDPSTVEARLSKGAPIPVASEDDTSQVAAPTRREKAR